MVSDIICYILTAHINTPDTVQSSNLVLKCQIIISYDEEKCENIYF
jgi:hypothetical protein